MPDPVAQALAEAAARIAARLAADIRAREDDGTSARVTVASSTTAGDQGAGVALSVTGAFRPDGRAGPVSASGAQPVRVRAVTPLRTLKDGRVAPKGRSATGPAGQRVTSTPAGDTPAGDTPGASAARSIAAGITPGGSPMRPQTVGGQQALVRSAVNAALPRAAAEVGRAAREALVRMIRSGLRG